MPGRCSVPGCRGNYDAENKVHVFAFPQDEKLKQAWIQAIPRKDFQYTKNSKVCERHFHPDLIERESTAYDEKNGKVLTAPLKRHRLKQDAVPHLFIGCPSYLSKVHGPLRETPGQRLLVAEERNINKAIAASLVTHEEYERSRKFNNFGELLICAKNHPNSSFWNKITDKENLTYLNLEKNGGGISLNYAVNIDYNLSLKVSFKGKLIHTINEICKTPSKIQNMNEISKVLDHIELNLRYSSNSDDSLIQLFQELLGQLSNCSNPNLLDFLKEQLSFVNCVPEKYRYSPELLIFSSLFFLVSPAAYKFFRQSGKVILPHPTTIQKISSKLGGNPQKEQNENHFLGYIRQKVSSLQDQDKCISLMMDEIHLKQCFDYKGGNIVGMSFDTTDCAKSAHVFMVQSLFSKYKDVVHILPVKKLTAEELFIVLQNIITGLEKYGFKVIVVVSDNNSINRKCVAYFQNPIADYVYPHPCDSSRPLFHCIDPVHLIKCVRNNWLNQKNIDQLMQFPCFDLSVERLCIAPFATIKKMYETEVGNLLKYGYTLSRKALWPNNLERQNVKLALQIFNDVMPKSILELGEKHNLNHFKTTAAYIDIFATWFKIFNVKTPKKGVHSRDAMCQPLKMNDSDENMRFLNQFVNWLIKWKNLNLPTGKLTKETHSALTQSTLCLIELTRYCVSELGMAYILPGKIQTDELEFRFGLYRRMAGTQYHVSIRQIFEVENKIRAFSSLKLNSQKKGIIEVDDLSVADEMYNVTDDACMILDNFYSQIVATDDDIGKLDDQMPVITYLAGYCVHSFLKKNQCEDCKSHLVMDKLLPNDPNFKVIHSCDRGGLRYPSIEVVNVVAHNFTVIQKIISSDMEKHFLTANNQRQLIFNITLSIIEDKEAYILTCENHSPETVTKHIVRSSTNTLLKNYCKSKNDSVSITTTNKRKLSTLTK